ncbi:ABC transporter permease [Paenibacillus sp. CAU 1782]
MLAMIYYDLLQMFRSKQIWFTLFALPISLIFILGAALANDFEGQNKDIDDPNLTVYIGENNPMGETLRAFLSDDSLPLNVTSAKSEAEVRESLQSKKADFGIILPSQGAELGDGASSSKLQTLLGKNSAQNIVAQSVLQQFVDGVNVHAAIQQMEAALGADGGQAAQETANSGSVPAAAVRSGHIVETSLTSSLGQFRAVEYYTAAMMVMFLMYSGMMAGVGILKEKASNTLSRINAMPVSGLNFLLAKIGSTLVITAIQVMVVLAVSRIFYDVTFGGQWHQVALLCLLMSLFSIALSILLALMMRSAKSMQTIFHCIIVLMTFLSGGFIAGVGGIITDIAKFTPAYWAKDGMLELVLQGSYAGIGTHYSLLAVMALILIAAMAVIYKKEGFR